MYLELRLNIFDTALKPWKATGFASEQYDQDTGKGQWTEHFMGWTALILRVFASPNVQQNQRCLGSQIGHFDTDDPEIRSYSMILGSLLAILVFRRRSMKFLEKNGGNIIPTS